MGYGVSTPPVGGLSVRIISCLTLLSFILTRLLSVGRSFFSMRSMTLGDVSRASKNLARLGWGLVNDDIPLLYLDATSMDDSLLVTLPQSSDWNPLSELTNMRPVPLSSSISGISLLMPQKSAMVMSLWLLPCLARHSWHDGRRIMSERKARM